MDSYFTHSLKSFILVILLLQNPLPLTAHEAIPTIREIVKDYPHILKCDTACHKVKNITLAKKNRTTQPECKNCHVGVYKPPISPFLSYNKVFLTETAGSIVKPDFKFTSKHLNSSSLPTSTN